MTTQEFMQALTPHIKKWAEPEYTGGNYELVINGKDYGAGFTCKVNTVDHNDRIETPVGYYYENWSEVTSVDVANLHVMDFDDVEPFTPEQIKELELLIAKTIEEYA